MSMLRRIVAILPVVLLAGSFAHAGGADLPYSGFDETSIEQGAGQRSADVHAAAGSCVVVCPGAECLACLPAALPFRVALARPSTSLAAEIAKHLRAPDTAPPKASFV